MFYKFAFRVSEKRNENYLRLYANAKELISILLLFRRVFLYIESVYIESGPPQLLLYQITEKFYYVSSVKSKKTA